MSPDVSHSTAVTAALVPAATRDALALALDEGHCDAQPPGASVRCARRARRAPRCTRTRARSPRATRAQGRARRAPPSWQLWYCGPCPSAPRAPPRVDDDVEPPRRYIAALGAPRPAADGDEDALPPPAAEEAAAEDPVAGALPRAPGARRRARTIVMTSSDSTARPPSIRRTHLPLTPRASRGAAKPGKPTNGSPAMGPSRPLGYQPARASPARRRARAARAARAGGGERAVAVEARVLARGARLHATGRSIRS